MQQQPSEIDKAIELLIALKSARPASFDDAMSKLAAAPLAGEGDDAAHASSLALGLLKGPFGHDSSGMLLELSMKLARMPDGALALTGKAGSKPASLVSRALRMHGLGSPWIRFLMLAMRDGKIPQDRECAFDLACRLEASVEDGEEGFGWLGHPDAFHEALCAFFSWDCDWCSISEQTKLDFLPWILRYWLSESTPASFESALKASMSLLAHGAISGLTSSSWLEFAKPTFDEHARTSIEAMRACLRACMPLIESERASPCLMFCKWAHPTPSMANALRVVIALDPHGPSAVDADGLSCAYFINARIADHESHEWQRPLLDCFDVLLAAGADPRLIAPQLALSSLARHPRIAAAVEAAQIGSHVNHADKSGHTSSGRGSL